MHTYKGERLPHEPTRVTVDGKPLDPRLDLRRHSPTGLEWGYSGSGPAQLSLAILAHHFGEPPRKEEPRTPSRAELLYQGFKSAVVAQWDGDVWTITSDEIEAVVQRLLVRKARP